MYFCRIERSYSYNYKTNYIIIHIRIRVLYNFIKLKVLINVFRNSYSNSKYNGIKIYTILFIQKPYLRTNYIQSNIEEDIDLKNQYRNEILRDPISIREPASKVMLITFSKMILISVM